MGKFHCLILSLIFSLLISNVALAAPTPNLTKALVLPLNKDASTNLLVIHIQGRTPSVSVPFVVDITARSLWVNCETNYKSSSLVLSKCGSPQCKEANTNYCHSCTSVSRPFCHANTCGLLLENPVTHQSTIGEVAQDVVAISSTDGSRPGPLAQVPNFLFTCSPSALVERGLPRGVQGIAGLGQGPIALQNQLASKLGFSPVFALCVPAPGSSGVMFFGDEPYVLQPSFDVSYVMTYTPLTISPFGEYYVDVKSLRIDERKLPINATLLSVDELGVGGTTISTTTPYTILEGSIYKVVKAFYSKLLKDVPKVKPVAPFGLCFDKNKIPSSMFGPEIPIFEFEMNGGEMWWFFGYNIMIEAKPGSLCLAFVDGGSNYRASITIGTYHLQDMIVQFDLGRSRFGFSPPLIGGGTSCAKFNFDASFQDLSM